jgi:hypothetical protein
MALSGADVGAIRNFVLDLRRRSQEVTTTVERLTTVIEGIPWVGLDRERFLQDWNGAHRPALVELGTDLLDAAKIATKHADEQEAASSKNGSW